MLRQDPAPVFGVSDKSLNGFMVHIVDRLNLSLKHLSDMLEALQKQFSYVESLLQLNGNAVELRLLQEKTKQIIKNYWAEKNRESIFNELLKQVVRFLEKHPTSHYKEFFEEQRLNMALRFNPNIDPSIFFQNHVVDFLERIYHFLNLYRQEYQRSIFQHYKHICLVYLQNKLIESKIDDSEIITKKRSQLQQIIETFLTMPPAKEDQAEIIKQLQEVFTKYGQAKKLYDFLVILKKPAPRIIDLEERIRQFADNDTNRWGKYLRVTDTSFGSLLRKTYNPAVREEKITDVEQKFINENFSLELRQLLIKAREENKASHYEEIDDHLDKKSGLPLSERKVVSDVIKIITNYEYLDKSFEEEYKQESAVCSTSKTILELYANMKTYFAKAPDLWCKIEPCFLEKGPLLNYDKATLEQKKLEVQNEYKDMLEILASSKQDTIGREELQLMKVLRCQFLLAAKHFFAKNKGNDKLEMKHQIYQWVKQSYSANSYKEFLILTKQILIDNGNKEFALYFSQVLHDSNYGLFYLIARDHKAYREFDIKKYLSKDNVVLDLSSFEVFENYIAQMKKTKISGEKALDVKVESVVQASHESQETFLKIENYLSILKEQQAKVGVYNFSLFAKTIQNIRSEVEHKQGMAVARR